MNKAIHALIVVFFGIGCALLWGMLTLVLHTTQRFLPGSRVPAFTSLCITLRPVLVILPILAIAYCLYAWFRRTQARDAWVGLAAALTASLLLMLIPTIIAAWLPLISIIERVSGR